MLELTYPTRALIGDWLRTVCGLAIGLGILIFMPATLWIVLIFGGVTLLFGYFGLRTLERQVQRLSLGDEGLLVDDWRRRALPWARLDRMRLRFYGTRRQQRKLHGGETLSGGFLELRLRADGRRVVVDSALPGFGLLAWRATQAARQAGLRLDPVTAGNLLTLGIDPDQDTQPPEMSAEWNEVVARS